MADIEVIEARPAAAHAPHHTVVWEDDVAKAGAVEDRIRAGLCDLGITADGLRLAFLTARLDGVGLADLESLSRFTHVQTLHLASNAVPSLAPLSALRCLTRLHAPKNDLTELLDMMPAPGNLREADLSHNRISRLPASGLGGYPALRVLTLRHNKLPSAVGLGALRSLRELDVAFNALVSLAGLEGLQLQVLDITGNRVASLAPVSQLPDLEVLRAGGNALASLTGLGGGRPPRLGILALGFNGLESLESLAALATLPQLRELDVRGNGLGSATPESRLDVVHLLPQLTCLDELPVAAEEKAAAANKHGADLAPLAAARAAHFPLGELDDGGGAPRPRAPAPTPRPAPPPAAPAAASPAVLAAAAPPRTTDSASAAAVPSGQKAWAKPEVQLVFFDARSWYHGAILGVKPPKQLRSILVKPSERPSLPLTILHFNDVYEIGEGKQEPVGGAARFTSLVNAMAAGGENPLVLFSGDGLNPSLLSQVTKGLHMVECLNEMNIAVACVGNHDLDFGVENLNAHIAKSNFPWLCSNCWHGDSGLPLGGAEEAAVCIHQGYKIGFVGLIEDDWLACCTTVDIKTLVYTDFVDVGRALAAKLKSEEGCDYVIALTHFREPNDERLAREAPEIDLVLGGHDHHYAANPVAPTGTWYVKSGADFRTASRVVIRPADGGGRGEVTVEKLEVTKAIPEDATVLSIAEGYLSKLRSAMQKKIGDLGVELDARFAEVRTKETNCGNWCADVMRVGCRADIGLLNSGTLRADVIYPPGPFTVEDLVKLLPFSNELMVVEVSGEAVADLLENGVSQWPKKEGRFPCCSNISFVFDGNKAVGERVLRQTIRVGGEPLNPKRHYTVAALDFAAKGKEGYTAFLTGTVIMDEEQATPLGTLMRNHLTCLDIVAKTMNLQTKRSTVEKALDAFARLRSKAKGEKPPPEKSTASRSMSVAPKLEGRVVNLADPPPGFVFRPADYEVAAAGAQAGAAIAFFDILSSFHPPVEGIVPPFQLRSGLAAPTPPTGTTRPPLTLVHLSAAAELASHIKGEPAGGAARFATALAGLAPSSPLLVFTGGALSPSHASLVTRGQHLVDALNALGVVVACVAPHDLDFGIDSLNARIAKSGFPWLCSNCWHGDSGLPLGGAEECAVIVHGGYKIGFVGLIDDTWIPYCSAVGAKTLLYSDYVGVGRALAAKLREEEGCEIVIALTHFRERSGERLAREAPEIDLVLGGQGTAFSAKAVGLASGGSGSPRGHDAGATWLVQSAAPRFEHASVVALSPGAGGAGRAAVAVTRLEATRALAEHPALRQLEDNITAEVATGLKADVADLSSGLDTTSAALGSRESATGNWLADVLRQGLRADCALLPAGCLGGTAAPLPAGPLSKSALASLLPMAPLAVVEVEGSILLELLEHGLAAHPAPDGRFPCVSSLRLSFDGDAPPGDRLRDDTVTVRGEPLDPARLYTVATAAAAARGEWGYEAFAAGRVVLEPEQAPPLAALAFAQLTGAHRPHYKTLHLRTRRAPVEKVTSGYARTLTKKRQQTSSQYSQEVAGSDVYLQLAPKVEGRITDMSS